VSEVLHHLRAAEDAHRAEGEALARLRAALAANVPPREINVPPETPRDVDPGRFNASAFFNAVRNSKALGPSLTTEEVAGCEAILAACGGFPLAWAAYCLATAVVEVAGTMQPIKERGGAAYFRRMYDIEGERPAKAKELGNLTPGDGERYCGRGYVQLTGRANYAKAAAALGLPLVEDPDLALRPDVAAQVMRRGMQEGWFTGKSLSSYLPAVADIHQFSNARRIVNGLDRAVEIAGYALEFQSALQAGGWR
jgi:putative chitinase